MVLHNRRLEIDNKRNNSFIVMINKCKLVRETCSWVVQHSANVKINEEKIGKLADRFHYTGFNEFNHHVLQEDKQDDENVLLYLFTLDSLNFCFWPLEGFEYEHLARSVKHYIEQGGAIEKLSKITKQELQQQIFSADVPLADERARILREMANVVISRFNGSISSIVAKSNKSAVQMLTILTQNFPNFQDHSIFQGHQIHFYKRAQILIGDIYAKFQGKGFGEFYDICQLTMFPDYRVPQILNEHGVLVYSQSLQQKIKDRVGIQSGSEEEIEIRAASVQAVELIKQYLKLRGMDLNSIEVDWFLWEEGEKNLKNIVSHHRTMTIYY